MGVTDCSKPWTVILDGLQRLVVLISCNSRFDTSLKENGVQRLTLLFSNGAVSAVYAFVGCSSQKTSDFMLLEKKRYTCETQAGRETN